MLTPKRGESIWQTCCRGRGVGLRLVAVAKWMTTKDELRNYSSPSKSESGPRARTKIILMGATVERV